MIKRWIGVSAAVLVTTTSAVASQPPGPVAAAGTGYVSLPAPARLLDTRPDGATVDGQFAAAGHPAVRLDAGGAGCRTRGCPRRRGRGGVERDGHRAAGRRVHDRVPVRRRSADRVEPQLRRRRRPCRTW